MNYLLSVTITLLKKDTLSIKDPKKQGGKCSSVSNMTYVSDARESEFNNSNSDNPEKCLFTYINVLTLSSHWETDGLGSINGTKYLKTTDSLQWV